MAAKTLVAGPSSLSELVEFSSSLLGRSLERSVRVSASRRAAPGPVCAQLAGEAAPARKSLPLASLSTEAGKTVATVASPPASDVPAGGAGRSGVPLFLGATLAAVGIFTALKSQFPGTKAVPVPAPPPAVEVPQLKKPRRLVADAALKKLYADFGVALVDNKFVSGVGSALAALGFDKDNSIALVNTCRDEITRPFVSLVEELYGVSFNTSGLGGLLTCGKVGFGAGMAHSPIHTDAVRGLAREKYIFFAFPHVAVDSKGAEGIVIREGRAKPSTACGALLAIKGEIEQRSTAYAGEIPEDDLEYGLLRQKIFNSRASAGENRKDPSLIDLTKLTEKLVSDDLEDLISKVVDPEKADYAVITGILIHTGCPCSNEAWTPDHVVDYIAPGTMYAVVDGRKYSLKTDGKQFYSKPVPESKGSYVTV